MKDKFLKWIKDVRNLIIIVLLGMVLFLSYCAGCGDKQTSTRTDTIRTTTIIPGDSIPYIKEVPKPYPVNTTVYVPVDVPIDTGAILEKYFEKQDYDIVLRDDTSMFIRIKTSVYVNELGPVTLDSLVCNLGQIFSLCYTAS